MRGLLKTAHAVDSVSELLGQVSVYLTVALVVIGFYNVAVRYLGRFIGVQLSSNTWIELQKYVFTLIFLFMFAYNLKHEVNVRVDFLYANWGPKRRALVDLLGTVLFLLPFCLLGIWVTWNPVVGSWRMGEMSPDPGGLPRAPLRTLVPLTFAMLGAQAVAQLIKYAAVLRGHTEVQKELEADVDAIGISSLE